MPPRPEAMDRWMMRLGVPPVLAVVLYLANAAASQLITELREMRRDIAIIRATVAPHVPPTARLSPEK